jgi:hypothetical protein
MGPYILYTVAMNEREFPTTTVELNFRDELPRLQAAAEALGDMSIRVVDDFNKALVLLREQEAAHTRIKYPEASAEECWEIASLQWSERIVGSFIGPEAVHAVTVITSNGSSVEDLHHTAVHGRTHGRTQL